MDYPIIEWIETAAQFCDEIVLVDMGTTDNTCNIIEKKFGNKIQIIKETWQFAKDYHEGAPRNRVLKAASGDWVYMTDLDEILHEKDFNKIQSLTVNKDVDFYRFNKIDFYGSCNLRYTRPADEKPALIQNKRGLYFGPPKNDPTKSAHTLLANIGSKKNRIARKIRNNKKIQDILLYHYGKCRSAKTIALSYNFWVQQGLTRRGLDSNLHPEAFYDEDNFKIEQPNLSNRDYVKWEQGHPKVMQEWVRKHWKIHGWEV